MTGPLLELDSVTVRRGMGIVLQDFNLQINRGECILLRGENGLGKSTIIEAAARLIPLEKGRIMHHNTLVCDHEGRRIKPKKPFGLTLQSNGVTPSETVNERLKSVCSLSSKAMETKTLLANYGLVNRSEDKIAFLSGGQQRKVAVLCGLMPAMLSREPRLILLDEPDAGLDENTIQQLISDINKLRSLGHGFLIASHNKEMMKCATAIHDLTALKQIDHQQHDAWEVTSTDIETPLFATRTGWRLNFSTLVSVQRNWLAALLVLGTLLTIADPLTIDDRVILMGFTLAPAFTLGLVGDPVLRILGEQRALDWWRAQTNYLPNSIIDSITSGLILTMLSSQIFLQDLDYRILIIGSLITVGTTQCVRFLQLSTIRLARSNAVFVRLLTPILILPWGYIVDYCAKL